MKKKILYWKIYSTFKPIIIFNHKNVWLKDNQMKNNRYWWEYGEIGPLKFFWGNVKLCSHCDKQFGSFSKNLKIELPYHTAILLLGICPGKQKTSTQGNTCKWMCIAALFIIAKCRSSLKCSSTDKCIYTMWCIHAKEHI